MDRRRLCCVLGLCVVVAVAVAVTVFMLTRSSKPLRWRGNGTTANISEIVLGRCNNYTQKIRPQLGHKNCQEIWITFKNSFLSKHPCKLSENDYSALVQMNDQTIPCNKILFWSKTKDVAHRYTQAHPDMYTLEDTLLGDMANDLVWCGDPSTSEMNTESCPDYKKDCLNNAVHVFWKAVSRKIAETACGVVYVMLNGSISPAFNKDSIFGSVEVLHLKPEKVSSLQALVMHGIGEALQDTCSSSSISDLKMILSQKNILFSCKDIYDPEKFIQCESIASCTV